MSIISNLPSVDGPKGAYQVGQSAARVSYAKAPSGWMNAGAIICPNGKRSLIRVLPIGYACENLKAAN